VNILKITVGAEACKAVFVLTPYILIGACNNMSNCNFVAIQETEIIVGVERLKNIYVPVVPYRLVGSCIFVSVQEYCIAYCLCREDKRLCSFRLSQYNQIQTCNRVKSVIFRDYRNILKAHSICREDVKLFRFLLSQNRLKGTCNMCKTTLFFTKQNALYLTVAMEWL
jgi:hypothetical protein